MDTPPEPLPPWRSTRLRIGTAFSLLALVLFATVGVLSGEYVARLRQRDASATLQQSADQLAQTLSNGLAERFREIEHAANLPPLVGHRLTADDWRAWLEQLQQSSAHYTWIGVADARGQVLAATGRLLEGRDVSQRPWFTAGARGAWMGGIHEAKLLATLLPPTPSGEPVRLFDIAAPVAGREGQVIGAHLGLAWAEEQRRLALRTMPPLASIEMRLITDAGELLLGPPLPAAQAQTRYLTAKARIAQFGPRPLGWTVVVRQPEAVALLEARTIRSRLWLFGLMGAALFGLVGWWLAGRLTAPLRQVADAARSAAHATGTHLPASVDEIGQLASALSGLLGQLREREQSLMQLNGTLEQRVLERTASLHQANQDLSLFARSISHDLRAPIASMATLLRHLLGDDPSLRASTRASLEVLAEECDRLGTLIQGLLDLGRLEHSRMNLERVPMGPLVTQVLAALQREGTLTTGTHVLVEELPEVTGDPVLLRQVWQNLLANAIKFSARAPSPRVHVRGHVQGQEQVFEVLDNGVGFDARQQHRLFGAFQRLHEASAYPGTGLGLSIVQRLVQRHGGRVWAAPREQGGALFGFALPFPAPAANASTAPQQASASTA